MGYVEPHGRAETENLMAGIERLATVPVAYRGVVRHELDLDAALKRRPSILLVDELAHSNLVGGEPAPRHPKRWQDIEELLDAGINVWTTLNVQHLESLNDLVAQITGVKQRETLPDHVFDEADEVELVDLPPDDLLARLRAGKVYVEEQAGTALERFFRKPNLIALRELALRRMTDRVEAAARASLAGDRTSREWLAQDHLLVAVGPDAQAEQLVRAGKRLADALRARWTVVYVETPELLAPVATGAQSPHRSPAARRVARRRNRHARRADGGRRAHRIRAHAARDARDRRRLRSAAAGAHCGGARRRPSSCVRRKGSTSSPFRSASDSPAAMRRMRDRGRRLRNAAALEALSRRGGDLGGLHGGGLGHVPVPRAVEPRDGLLAGRRHRGLAHRPLTVGVDGRFERAVLRLLLRAAAFPVRRFGRPVPVDVRGHADRCARDRDAHGACPPTDASRRRARAAHGTALRDEPRACRHARQRRHRPPRREARRRSISVRRCRAVAGRDWAIALSA